MHQRLPVVIIISSKGFSTREEIGYQTNRVWQISLWIILINCLHHPTRRGHDVAEATMRTDLVVDNHMNDFLCAPFTAEEVHKAIFYMHPSKAPGPNGFTALFYQKLWPIIGEDITAAVLSILNANGEVSHWNSTLITLIPKIKTPCLERLQANKSM